MSLDMFLDSHASLVHHREARYKLLQEINLIGTSNDSLISEERDIEDVEVDARFEEGTKYMVNKLFCDPHKDVKDVEARKRYEKRNFGRKIFIHPTLKSRCLISLIIIWFDN